MDSTVHDSLEGIAVIGMAGRFPKAKNLEEFWQNLRQGVEGISFFSDEELLASGVDPGTIANANYVKAGAMLENMEMFDAPFFDYTPREAEAMDPQHRVFLETAWHALEDGGYDPEKYEGHIGVFAGVSMNAYLWHNIYANPEFVRSVGGYQLMIANDKDFVGTNVSYKFNLRGPSLDIQTACSTSLVAIAQACQSLLSYQSDMVLAGGVSVGLVKKVGYMYQSGGIASPDGHCRTFDEKAKGTVPGNGVGVVLLKRLADAVEDGDHIYAVIKGSALNNDGSLKVGFTAPSVDGQAEAIAMAQAVAGFEADTLDYIEAHGTATELGDPIEIAALTKAFRATTDKKGFCAIGSVKSNIGHLDAAAGVAGFIKAVLSLYHAEIPPSLHFEKPNPNIDFENSPFFVNAKLQEWKTSGKPRRAGVSSFGIGGTNAHVVLEQAPDLQKSGIGRAKHLLLLSAKSRSALDAVTGNLADHLEANPDLNVADIALTLQLGRQGFKHRRVLVCDGHEDAVASLRKLDGKRVFTATQESGNRAVAFMFPGQGAQYANMGREIYDAEPLFRQTVDDCCELLKTHIGCDLREILFPDAAEMESANARLKGTAITQPAIFVIEYALAKLWMAWGLEPQAMIGHSIGEYVAACLAGVFSLEDALKLVAARGRLMQDLPVGSMLAVSLPEDRVSTMLEGTLAIAAINGPAVCVVSGPAQEVDDFEMKLKAKGIDGRRLHTSHAFHSAMMDAILEPFKELVRRVQLSAPQLPFVSNLTGKWLRAEEATSPDYWAKHLRNTVRFADGAELLLEEPSRVMIEVGPGRTLATLSGMILMEMKKQTGQVSDQVVISSMRHPDDNDSDMRHLLNALGKVWLAGIEPNWSAFYAGERRHRLPLPGYPFEHQRYWVEPQAAEPLNGSTKPAFTGKKTDIAEWFYLPSWKRQALSPSANDNYIKDDSGCWLIFTETSSLSKSVIEHLSQAEQRVVTVGIASHFDKDKDGHYIVNPANKQDYEALVMDLRSLGLKPNRIVHLWNTGVGDSSGNYASFEESQQLCFYSILYLAQEIGRQFIGTDIELFMVTGNMQEVTGTEKLCADRATVLGPCKVIPQEYPNIRCKNIDLAVSEKGQWQPSELQALVAEMTKKSFDLVVALRGSKRWVQNFDAVSIKSPANVPMLREGGVYLITGGLGRIGFTLAEELAKSCKAKLVLTGRSAIPASNKWQAWVAEHGEDDSISQKIKRVQALEALGAEVLIASADVSNLEQMQKVVDDATRRFGKIDGVIHGAGMLDGASFSPLLEISREECEGQFQPKVGGLLILDQLLGKTKLDFCFLLSSISSVLGGLGFVAYSAANLFMDVFANVCNKRGGTSWQSINWDAWEFDENKQNEAIGSSVAALALTPKEGADVFRRALFTSQFGQILVSTGDLDARIRKWVQLEALRDSGSAQASGGKGSGSFHARPELAAEYVAPCNEIEATLAVIWQDLFGMDRVGIHDNFFELGGHSLLATGLVSRVRDTYRIELGLHTFFERPTIAELSEFILEQMVAEEDSDTLSQLLAEIEGDTE